jgi:uncharacterized phage protein (TIGR02218 family)
MNFLGQPVFLFNADWGTAVTRSVQFELRPEDIGYGIEFFTPTQSWTVNGWSFSVDLPDAPTLASYDAFTAALVGRLSGFWLPVPVAAAAITAGTSTSVFSVTAQSLSTYWNARPATYLLFTFGDGTQAAAKIQSVVAAGATETVTLTAALAQVPDAHTTISLLHFVRLANDEEAGDFYQECGQTRAVDVIELPLEYAEAQTGIRPIYLYHFWALAPVQTDWYFTSFAAPVVSNGKLYQNFPIDFTNLQHVADGSSDDLKLTAKPDPNSPLVLFQPVPFSGTLYVQIFVVDFNDLNDTTSLFSGRVVNVKDMGSNLEATCESRLGFLKRKIPRFLKGPTCNNILYDPNTCRARRALFTTIVNITAINVSWPTTITCTFVGGPLDGQFKAANFLANGLIEGGEGVGYESRSVLASSFAAGVLTLTVNQAPAKLVVGEQVTVVAGCDHTAATCQNVFNNYVNFTGFIAIPPRNPTVRAVNANQVSQGGK